MTPNPEASRLAEEAKHLVLNALDPFYIDTDRHEEINSAIDALAALAKQDAAPTSAARLDAGPWAVTETGNVISADFKHDVVLGISGDFANKAERMAYGRWLADTLNAAPTSASTVQEWISVEDRLPKEFCYAWIANFDDVQKAIWSDTDREFLVEDVYGAYEKAHGVTHWMLFAIPARPGACSVTDGEAKNG